MVLFISLTISAVLSIVVIYLLAERHVVRVHAAYWEEKADFLRRRIEAGNLDPWGPDETEHGAQDVDEESIWLKVIELH